MVGVYMQLKKRKMKSKLILQIHDELVVDAENSEIEDVRELMKNIMEKAVNTLVPLKVVMETGKSLYETK